MSQFLLYYTGKGPKPQNDVRKVSQIPGVIVLTEPSSRSVLLDISNDIAAQHVRHFREWTLQASQTLTLEPQPLEDLMHSQVPAYRIVR